MASLTVALAPPAHSRVDAEWLKVARDSVFPFDGTRNDSVGVHDPSILKFKGSYLLIHTSGHELSPISTSPDLLHWKHYGPILPAQPDWLKAAIPGHRSVWAPAPVAVGDTLRVYYCASEKFGSNTSYIAFAECRAFDPAKPTEGWVDKGLLIKSKAGESNFNAIDPDVLIGPDGRHWMVYGSYWSGMYQVELDPASGGLKNPDQAPLHVASNTGERSNPLEAPVMLYHDGWYYLVVTYGLAAQGIRSTYRMVCGRSKEPTGPFLGYDGKPMTEGGNTSLLKGSSPMFAPGGGNFFSDETGEWMAFHYYDGRLYWHGDVWGAPTLQIRRVMWGADGWPLPGLPAGVELEPAKGGPEGAWAIQADFGRVRALELTKTGAAKLEDQEGSWEERDGQLFLSWPSTAAPSGHWIDSLRLDRSRQYAVGRNQAGVVVRAIKQDAQTTGQL